MIGDKHDNQKPRYSLLPLGIVYQVIAVLEFGALKYEVDNWQHVPDARRRYYDAAMRHVDAWWGGEQDDPESGQHHLAHACACLFFLMWFDARSKVAPVPVKPERPWCFGKHPFRFPHIQAEHGCSDCPHNRECVDTSGGANA